MSEKSTGSFSVLEKSAEWHLLVYGVLGGVGSSDTVLIRSHRKTYNFIGRDFE